MSEYPKYNGRDDEKILRQRRASAEGKLAEKGCKLPRVGSVKPRTEVESTWLECFNTVTPVPEATLRRANAIIIGAILHIHFGQPLAQISKFTGINNNYLETVKKEDRWDEFAQTLTQMMKPSNLALVPQHDIPTLQAEMERRAGTVEKLREKERSLMLALPMAGAGTLAEAGILSNIKKIRDLIDSTIGLDHFRAESHAARKTVITGQAKALLGTPPEAPREAKGQVVQI